MYLLVSNLTMACIVLTYITDSTVATRGFQLDVVDSL